MYQQISYTTPPIPEFEGGRRSASRRRDAEPEEERDDIDDDLYRIAPLNGRATLTYQRNAWWTALEGVAYAKQDEVSETNNEQKTDAYQLLNLRGGLSVGRGLSLSAGVENILDSTARDHLAGLNRVTDSDVAVGERLPVLLQLESGLEQPVQGLGQIDQIGAEGFSLVGSNHGLGLPVVAKGAQHPFTPQSQDGDVNPGASQNPLRQWHVRLLANLFPA